MTTAHPLAWPAGWPRAQFRTHAPFHKRKDKGNGWTENVPVSMAVARLQLGAELDRLGARSIVLSTNVELNLNGEPRGDRARPSDVGVACYFKLNGRDTVLACDKWLRVEDNIVAISKHIEALRGQERWGVGSVEQAFTGYQALPAPEQWWQVLAISPNANVDDINAAWRKLSASAHPDKPGGSDAAQARINAARDTAISSLTSEAGR
ncbi:J domain-containing protein [Sphingomonas koreensis]|uniref:J domain-containing protein n=1 Tax=Sphingomonas koreensis TaxID=93064 RepID=A0A430G2D7_9SPHN|nr:J domain-containing protein [Sphingomonas koreensis]RSY83134.1 J domain-containing protein [Sphingomonas koreensis]